jgi:3-isopropylmalate/(R)-2-methylmalate dehydratase small subunit
LEQTISGVAWKCGDNVTAYQIIAQKRWTMNKLDPAEMGMWVFEGADPSVKDVPDGFKSKGYKIVVAGEDFGGGGKSIEHPILAMQGAGIVLLVAESFSRYNFRNAINLGLPAIMCPGVTKIFASGDRLEADLLSGKIKNLTTGAKAAGIPLSDFVLKLIESGGLLEYYRKKLDQERLA